MRKYNMDLKGIIHSVETCGTVDGPGIRYVVFFQGCFMNCLYCHNPDTRDVKGGREITVDELLQDVLKYKSYMKFSGGGFTASGGEPLLQARFIAELFKQLKKNGVHTTVDTSGYADLSKAEELFSYTDLVLLDIKSIDPKKHIELTEVKINATLRLAEYLNKKRIPVWIRYVVVPGYTDSEEDVAAMAKYLRTLSNIQRVGLLPFHKIGEIKWEAMGLPYKLKDTPTPDKAVMKRLREIAATGVSPSQSLADCQTAPV